jgi:hypothetical protein
MTLALLELEHSDPLHSDPSGIPRVPDCIDGYQRKAGREKLSRARQVLSSVSPERRVRVS